MSHPLAELQPATRRPAAGPLSAAGRAAAVPPAKRPSSHSERRALCRPAASPPDWSISAGPGSSGSLIQKFVRFTNSRARKHSSVQRKKNKQMTSQVSRYLATCGSSEFEPRQLVSPLQTRLCTPLLPPDSWAENTVTKCCTVYKWRNVMFSISELLYTLIHQTQTYTYLSTASLMSLIQVFRSSLDDVWTSYISGPAADALIKNIPLSSFATSRTISFCRAMTGGFWSWRTLKAQRISSLQDKIEKVIECRTVTETQQTAVLEPGYLCGN